MRDENAFNAHLTRHLKHLLPETYTLKVAQKYHVGIADFQVFRGGQAVVFETKLLKERPGPRTTKVLKHPFTGPQLTYLRCVDRAGVPAFGVVGVEHAQIIRVIPLEHLPPTGNWTTMEWSCVGGPVFRFDQTRDLIDHLFSHHGGPNA